MAEWTVRALEAEEWPRWNAFVATHPHGTIFQTTEWLRRLKGRLFVLAIEAETGGALLGGLPLLRNRRFLVEGFHPPALTPYMGPLIGSSDSEKEDARRSQYQKGVQLLLCALPRTGHVDFLLHPGQTNVLPYLWNGFNTEIGYTNILSGSVEEFHRCLSYSHRKRLNRLLRMQEGGLVEVVELDDPRELDSLLHATMLKKRFRIDQSAVGRLITIDGCGTLWKAVKVQADGQALGCMLVAIDARAYYGLLAGVSRKGEGELANAQLLCYDYLVGQALESGRFFDFCGSSLPGVDQFNRRYGTRLLPRIRVLKSRSLLMSTLRIGRQLHLERRPAQVVE